MFSLFREVTHPIYPAKSIWSFVQYGNIFYALVSFWRLLDNKQRIKKLFLWKGYVTVYLNWFQRCVQYAAPTMTKAVGNRYVDTWSIIWNINILHESSNFNLFFKSLTLKVWSRLPGGATQWCFTRMTMAYSNMANVTKMVHNPSQISIRERLSEAGVFSLALPDMLINMRSVVIKMDILPWSGGIEKLNGIKKIILKINWQKNWIMHWKLTLSKIWWQQVWLECKCWQQRAIHIYPSGH